MSYADMQRQVQNKDAQRGYAWAQVYAQRDENERLRRQLLELAVHVEEDEDADIPASYAASRVLDEFWSTTEGAQEVREARIRLRYRRRLRVVRKAS